MTKRWVWKKNGSIWLYEVEPCDHLMILGCAIVLTTYHADGTAMYFGEVAPSRLVTSTWHLPNDVLFLLPDNLVDMKLLLETTVALRENSNGT